MATDTVTGTVAPPTPPLNPLTHLLDPTSSNFSDDEDGGGLDAVAKDEELIPQQRTSIVNQRAVIRYYPDPQREPALLEDGNQSEENDGSCIDVSLLLDVTTGCGGKIWPAARWLGAYLTSKKAELAQRWAGKTVVELGSGTGLVGFVLAKMKIDAQTWITDQDAMLRLMDQNLKLNPGMDLCHVAELNWGEPIPEGIPAKPDVLLLADCVYLEVAFQPLVDTMRDLSDDHTEILFCYMKRRKADKRFFTLLKKHFTFDDVQDDDATRTKTYQREGLRLYTMKLKK
ncbi:unnamed protein product [Parajaminaea phylloscopi]